MKRFLLLLIIYSACSYPTERKPVEVVINDTIFSLSDTLKAQLTSEWIKIIQTKDSTIIKKNADIDFLLKDVQKYQGNEIELNNIRKKFLLLHNYNQNYIDSIKRSNVSLAYENANIASSLEREKKSVKKISLENNSLQSKIKSAAKLSITDIKIQAYYFPRFMRFGKEKKTEIYEAKKVKQVEVTFVPVENVMTNEGNYSIIATMKQAMGHKGLSHSIIYTVPGLQTRDTIVFNEPEQWQQGFHDIEISIDNKLVYSGSVNLK